MKFSFLSLIFLSSFLIISTVSAITLNPPIVLMDNEGVEWKVGNIEYGEKVGLKGRDIRSVRIPPVIGSDDDVLVLRVYNKAGIEYSIRNHSRKESVSFPIQSDFGRVVQYKVEKE